MALTLRSASTTTATTKGAYLTHAEMDANWLHLAQSANVDFTQSGSGAIATTVQDRLRQAVSVLDFIPVALHAAIKAGTSTMDVTTYIQAAIDSFTNGGVVYFPPGAYNVSSTISLSASYYGVSLVGHSSRNGSQIIWTNATPGTVILLSEAHQAEVKDLSIYGASFDGATAADAFAIGILVNNNSTGWRVSNVWFINDTTGVAVQAGNDTDTVQASEGLIEFCNMNQIGTGVYVANVNAQCITIQASNISYWDKGIHNRNGSFAAIGNWLASNAGATAAFYFDGGYDQLQIIGNKLTAGASKILGSTTGTLNGGYAFIGNTLTYSTQTTAVDDNCTHPSTGGAIWLNNYFGAGGATDFDFTTQPKLWMGNSRNINITLKIGGVAQVAKSDAFWRSSFAFNTNNPGSRFAAFRGIVGVTDSNDAEAGYINPGTGNCEYVAAGSRTLDLYSNSKLLRWDGTAAVPIVTVPGVMRIATGTAVPAGGTAGVGYMMSSTTTLGVYFGSGVPTLAAAQGSLYMRTDGSSTSTRLYVNTNGSTGWTNVTTAA